MKVLRYPVSMQMSFIPRFTQPVVKRVEHILDYKLGDWVGHIRSRVISQWRDTQFLDRCGTGIQKGSYCNTFPEILE